jgi:superfamily I DNA/RNA helicase
LKEDLARNGLPFMQRYEESLSLKQQLTDDQVNAVIAALLPDIAIPHITPDGLSKETEGIVRTDRDALTTYNLSLEQEQIAKSLGEGPRLLRGIAGTGKTLIMLYRAKMQAANHKDVRILLLCWNVSLANYMRQAYKNLQFEAEDGVTTILNFTQFVRRLFLSHGIDECDPDTDDFTLTLRSLKITDGDRYDAIYIDEAQDFRREWISFIYQHMLKGKEEKRNLLIAADDAQRIYHKRDFRWADLGIPMQGRSKVLKTIYRNSARVWMFSAFLLGGQAAYGNDSDGSGPMQFSTKGGYDPLVIKCDTPKAQIDSAIQAIRSIHQAGFAFRNVLILYRSRNLNKYPLVDRLTERLQKEKIQYDWITENKSSFDWQADTVKISTVHSAKGMDCPVVIILGAESFNAGAEGEEDDLKLLYVAMTRAREILMIMYSEEVGLLPAIHHCENEYKKYLPLIVKEESAE